MMRVRVALGLAALQLALASPPASPPLAAQSRPAAREAPVPFRVGETLTFDVTWSTFLVAGSATSTVVARQPAADSTSYHVVADGRPIPLPPSITIPRGTAVIFHNNTRLHALFGEPERPTNQWRAGPVHPGAFEAQVFRSPGVYELWWSGARTLVIVT